MYLVVTYVLPRAYPREFCLLEDQFTSLLVKKESSCGLNEIIQQSAILLTFIVLNTYCYNYCIPLIIYCLLILTFNSIFSRNR